VSATNNYGTSGWSTPIWSFTTAASGTAPQAPILSLPSNNAPNQSTSPTLSWNASGDAISYTLQVSVNSLFTSFVFNQSGLTSLSKQVTSLGNLTTYYWRVSATNNYGTSDWSTPTWSFTTAVEMIYVEGGEFLMGNVSGSPDERTVHKVTVNNFYIDKFEVTQEEYQKIMGTNPSIIKKPDAPVENVSWNDAVTYANRVGKRLPTEAEWEYAARGGKSSKNYTFSGSNIIGDVAWYLGNSNNSTHSVGTRNQNELFIYDMSGNVWEWCSDWYGTYPSIDQNNPTGPSSGTHRVIRGGSWFDGESSCRVSVRSNDIPGDHLNIIGFRCAK
jgi:formylglycine-generating enzyme required for sulfatase activity